MSMISMAVYDTVENKRTEFTRRTLQSLLDTVDFSKHRIIIVDNGSCDETKRCIQDFWLMSGVFTPDNFVLHTLGGNVGTARAINIAWKERKPGEHCVKMDNDVVIHYQNWIEDMEFCIQKRPEIGIIGLKRKDLEEFPGHLDENFRSQLIMVPHERGERWMVVEAVGHVIGTCQMYNSALLDKIGYLYQPGIYGFDDVLSAYRAAAIGFWNVFLPHINIDHIDPGGDAYTEEKRAYVKQYVQQIHIRGHEYLNQQRPVWEDA